MEEIQKYLNAIDIYKDIESIDRRNIVICGMGGSAIAGDYVKEIFDEKNIIVVRDYFLPKFINKDYLCICISYSGNTEETISCMRDAINRGLDVIAITSGGILEEISKKNNIRLIKLPKGFQPRFAFPYIFISLLSLIDKSIVHEIKKVLNEISIDERFVEEISKKIFKKPLVIICYNKYYPVAFRFKSQLNENAKHVARIELIPEMNHNEIETYYNDINHNFLMLIGGDEFDRIRLRFEFVKKIIMDNSVGEIIEINGHGNFLKNIIYFTILLDNVSMYLAKLKGVNPHEIRNINSLKDFLSR